MKLPAADRRLASHSFPRSAQAEIVKGLAGPATMASLVAAEHSRRRLMLRAVVDAASRSSARGLADPEPAWSVLVAVEQRDPNVIRELILHPPFGVWLRRTITRMRDVTGPGETLGYLYSLAAAAAVRTATTCVLSLPVRHGTILLPTVGCLTLPVRFPAGSIELEVTGPSSVSLRAMNGQVIADVDLARPNAMFRPAIRHTANAGGLELTIWIDDIDPYREFAEPLPPGDTDPTELMDWRKLLSAAWDLLTRWHPGRAVELSATLNTVTLVDSARAESGFSSAAAVGCVAVPMSLSTSEIAETLVHECQHSKVNAVSHLADLAHDTPERYYAPWRDDARPLRGMIHGLYAFMAVAEFWLANEDEHDVDKRAFLLAYRRQQVGWALRSLGSPSGLTDLGAALCQGIRQRLASCERHPVDTDTSRVADRMIRDHYAYWRLSNVRADETAVAALVARWRDGQPPSPLRSGTFLAARSRPPGYRRRSELLRAKATDRFAGMARAALHSGRAAAEADVAYCHGQYDEALERYLRIPGMSADAFVGAGLCLHELGRQDAARALLERPEVVAALCVRLAAASTAAEPTEVAAWLGCRMRSTRVGAP